MLLSAVLVMTLSLPAFAVTLTLQGGGALSGQTVVVPLTIDSANGVLGADFLLKYTPSVLQVVSVTKTPLTSGSTLVANTSVPGEISLTLFGTTPLDGGGSLVNITFSVIGAAGLTSVLDIDTASLNEGAIPATLVDGTLKAVAPSGAQLPPPSVVPALSPLQVVSLLAALVAVGVLLARRV